MAGIALDGETAFISISDSIPVETIQEEETIDNKDSDSDNEIDSDSDSDGDSIYVKNFLGRRSINIEALKEKY